MGVLPNLAAQIAKTHFLTNLKYHDKKQQLKDRFLAWMILLCVALPMQVWAQKLTVTGTVVEQNGEPVIGATVMEKGTANGTSTDIDGNFTINVDEKELLWSPI